MGNEFPGTGKLDQAIQLASKLHSGQSYGTLPYIFHPFRVATRLIEDYLIEDHDVLAAAILHDVIEDTDVTIPLIMADFGTRIAQMVHLLTKEDDGEPYQKYISHIASHRLVGLIKRCDLLDHLSHAPKPSLIGRYEAALRKLEYTGRLPKHERGRT